MEEEKEMVRIFVGGLGESVTADELRRVFELSGGAVESLEFVRSKARSCAYVDFSPSSDKSLSKLLAKYNGCVWKGGKLKLEKAKEHYLKRLEREWAEEAAAKANAIQATQVESSESPQILIAPEKRGDIRMFFPRLRKVKMLPFNGTGKHKYSFQRFEFSLPPKYFCDCEEHSGPAEKEKRVCRAEPESSGVNEEELNIMDKVMNTIFQKQNGELIDNYGASLADNSDNESDDDDLVINFVSKGSNEFASLERKQVRQVPRNQLKSGSLEQRSKRGRSQEQKRNDSEPQTKKKKPLSHEQNDEDKFKSAISTSKGDLYTNSDKPSKLMEAKRVEPETSKWQSNAHVSWSQKSSWKKLVGDKSSNTFSIASTEEHEPRLDPPSSEPDAESKKENSERDIPVSTEKPEPRSDALCIPDSDPPSSGPDTESKKENSERDISASIETSDPRSDALCIPDSDSKNGNFVKEGEFEGGETKTEALVEPEPAKPNVVSSQTKRGSSWMQKSLWKQLVGDNASFSISQPFPCTTFAQQVSEKPKEGNALSSVNASINETENQASGGGPSVPETEKKYVSSSLKDDKKAILAEKCDVVVTQIPPVRVEVSETCTFMRSAASLKEWAKAKAALSGSLKRNGNQK